MSRSVRSLSLPSDVERSREVSPADQNTLMFTEAAEAESLSVLLGLRHVEKS